MVGRLKIGKWQSCDANYHSAISGRNKIGHVFQQLMSVMKEERKMTSGRISVRLSRRN